MLQIQNKHWKEGFFYGFHKHRKIFYTLIKYMEKRICLALTGLRRVGKTVLMWQIIDWLIDKGVKRKNIIYFSYDKAKISIDELLEEYSKLTGIDYKKERVYVFLDEIQKLENWQEQLKFYYDLYDIKFVVSGSASLFIKKGVESLGGRIFEFEIPILTFEEFLIFKGMKIKKQDIKIYKEDLKILFTEYIRKNFIEILDEDENFYKMYYESIINKVIFEDIPKLFPVENPAKLKALFEIFLNNPGLYLKYESLASDLGLSRKTVEKYVEYLIKAKLIFKVYNFSKNFITSEKKIKRIYLTAPCFCFLSEELNISIIIENLAILFSNSRFFYRDPRKNEIDLIVKEKNKIVPIEIKYKDKIKKEEIKPILLFLEKFEQKEGLIITWDYEDEEKIKNKKIKFMPLWKWLLS